MRTAWKSVVRVSGANAPLRSECARRALSILALLCAALIAGAQEAETQPGARPPVLDSQLPDFVPMPELAEEPDLMLRWPVDSPLGYSGPSGVLPRDGNRAR